MATVIKHLHAERNRAFSGFSTDSAEPDQTKRMVFCTGLELALPLMRVHQCILLINAARKIQDVSHDLLGNRSFYKPSGVRESNAVGLKTLLINCVIADTVSGNQFQLGQTSKQRRTIRFGSGNNDIRVLHDFKERVVSDARTERRPAVVVYIKPFILEVI